MKAIFTVVFTAFLLLYSALSFSQQSIKITAFSDKNIANSDDAKPISEIVLNKKGYVLKIPTSLNIVKVFLAKKDGGESSMTKKIVGTDDCYRFQAAFVNSANQIKIRICTDAAGTTCKTILLDVLRDKPAAAIAQKSSCNLTLFKEQDCSLYDKANNFGINAAADFFDENDVIYIYAFDKDESKRRWYKIINNQPAVKANMSTEKLCDSKQVYFKIAGLNQFVYEAAIDEALISFDSEPSLLFNRLFLGDTTSLTSLMDMDGIVAQSFDSRVDPLVDEIRCFYEMYTDLKAELHRVYTACVCFPECNEQFFPELLRKRNAISTGITLIELDYAGKGKDLETLKKQEDECAQFNKITREITALNAKPSKTSAEVLELNEKIAKKAKMSCVVDGARAGEIAEIEKDMAVVAQLAAVKQNLPSETEINAATVFVQNMVKQNQSYWKGPIQLDGNILEFSLDIKKRDYVVKTFNDAPFSLHLPYTIPIYGSPFVSFSSGSFIAIEKHLQDKVYAWQQIPTTSNNYRLVESGYSELPMGFAALGNVEWKLTKNFGIGPSVGVGITIEDKTRIAYLAGASTFVGKWRQLAITGGVAAMQVNELNAAFQEIADNQIISTTKPTIEYNKQLRVGPFISLTYTPFKSVRKKTKKEEDAAATPAAAADPKK